MNWKPFRTMTNELTMQPPPLIKGNNRLIPKDHKEEKGDKNKAGQWKRRAREQGKGNGQQVEYSNKAREGDCYKKEVPGGTL